MKHAAIIGGGLAGLATAISLNRIGIKTTLFERSPVLNHFGMGFLMLPNGMMAMELMGLNTQYLERSTSLQRFIHRLPDGRVIRDQQLEEFISISRFDLLDIMMAEVPADSIKLGYSFSKFHYRPDGTAEAVEFENGEVVTADFFVASDGANSRIRNSLFPKYQLTPELENEIVGIVDAPDLVAELGPNFLKTQMEKIGLSFGVLPANKDQLIWFMQFDIRKFPAPEEDPKSIERFVRNLVETWPHPIPKILDRTDFSQVHVWRVKGLELLPAFYRKNIVLTGDAAHPVIPLTSQGANSALIDGVVLGFCMEEVTENGASIEEAFRMFDLKRRIVMNTFLKNGKVLLEKFLSPDDLGSDPPPFLVGGSPSKG